MSEADIVIGVDRGSGREVVFYGQSTLDPVAAGLDGPAPRLRIVRVPIDFNREYSHVPLTCVESPTHVALTSSVPIDVTAITMVESS